MRFPYVIVKNLDNELRCKWENYYEKLEDKYTNRDRKVDEGIWRRTQMFGTRHESGWKNHNDMRRRMLHYMHTYDVIKDDKEQVINLCMVSTYIWLHLTFPEHEIEQYLKDILDGLKLGKWKLVKRTENFYEYNKGDLYYCIWQKNFEKEDNKMNREFPQFYKCLEIRICTEDKKNNSKELEKAWGVLNNGPRIKDRDGDYTEVNDIKEIKKYLPAHIELGCGPSIELGIPPLNFLHDVYYVTNKSDNTFVLGPEQDKLGFEIAAHTEKMYELFSTMYKKCFLAKPDSQFYSCLQKLFKKGALLDPLYTNNFDGIPIQLGLNEYFLRRYEQENLIPDVFFDKRAKSLISVGCHADRRKIQEAARRAGLKVIHIDPEGYTNEVGEFTPYELEAKKDGDLFYKKDSSVAFSELLESIKDSCI